MTKNHLPGAPKPEAEYAVVRPLRPMNSLLAAAQAITTKQIARKSVAVGKQDWQAQAWDLGYSQVGEVRFVAQQVGRAVGRVRFGAAVEPDDQDAPTFITDIDEGRDRVQDAAVDLMSRFAGGDVGRAALMQRIGIHLFVVGESYLVGTNVDDDPDLEPDEWFALGPGEISSDPSGRGWQIETGSEKRFVPEEAAVVVRIWSPHPQKWWLPDSPVCSAMHVIVELIGLTQHVDASIQSRLAGAGLLILPNSVSMAAGMNPGELEDDADPIVETLIETMSIPIKDRDSAAAIVPLILKVPDEVVDKVSHLTFERPFAPELRELREEAIRRLALALDAPPEVLLGLSESNHWNAWAIEANFARLSIEPLAALICDAITIGYLRPALSEMGFADEEIESVLVWYDASALVGRPDNSDKAVAAFDRGSISRDALRRELGFGDEDAPAEQDEAVTVALDLVRSAPSLAQTPGLTALIGQVRAALDGTEAPVEEEAAPAAEADLVDDAPTQEAEV